MKGYIFGDKDLDLHPKAAKIKKFSRWIAEMIARYALALYVLATGLVIVAIHAETARTMAFPVDDRPAVAACSFCREPDLLTAADPPPEPREGQRGMNETAGEQVRFGVQEENEFPVFVLEEGSVTEIWTSPQPAGEILKAAGIRIGAADRVEPEGIVRSRAEIRIFRAENERPDSGFQSAAIRAKGAGLSRGATDLPESGNTSPGGTVEHTTGITKQEKKISGIVEVTATAYCPGTPGSGCPLNQMGHSQCTGCYNDGYTYTGKKATQGEGTLESPRMVAVDPRVIPLLSTVYLEGIGFAVAEDIGGAIKGNRIDILFDLHRDASEFGLKKGMRLYLLSEAG